MSVDASPPPQPPQMSPDGKWVWNGTEWQPVGTHQSVFPNWNSIRVEPAQPVAQAVMTQPEPVMSYPVYAMPDAAPAAPLWQRRSSGLNKYLYGAAGLVVLVIAIVLLRAMAPFIVWPWTTASDPRPVAAVPSPLATRSDYARTDRFVRTSLTPAINALLPTLLVFKETCNGLLTVSCQNAMTASDKQVKVALAAIDREAISACIAAPTARLRNDINVSDAALEYALKGYQDNQKTELASGIAILKKSTPPIAADAAAVAVAQRTCDTQLVGP